MASEWTLINLRDVIVHKKGYAFKSKDYVASGIPVVKVTNLTNNGIDMSNVVFVNVDIASVNSSVKLMTGDIIITTVGSWAANPASVVGKTIKVPFEAEGALLNQNAVRLRPKNDSIDHRFLYYLLKNNSFGKYLIGNAQGSANQASITLDDIYSYEAYIPSLIIQKGIAQILSTLDDKIELNRKMNQTLEEMAQALFKSWFVDFDPVHAKADVKSDEASEHAASELGISKELMELFPSEFEESEMGMIPFGWVIGTLGDIVIQRNERITASEETKMLPYVPTDCIDSKSLSLSNIKSGEEAKSSLIKFYKGDILFGAMRPYFHKVCVAPVNGTTRTTVFVLNTHEKNDYAFGLLCLYQEATVSYATRHSTGTTIPYAKWLGVLEKMPIVIPGVKIRESFNSIIEPLLKKISSTYKEQVALQKTRDTLLPKLLSGELDVSEVEI